MTVSVKPYIEAAKDAVTEAVHSCAAALGLPAADIWPTFDAHMRAWLKGGFKADGRASTWRARVRLFQDGQSEAKADSDPDLQPNMPGTMVFKGLPAVAECVASMGSDFHGGPCAGLDAMTLRDKLKGLRPTLSRRRGNAAWRVEYTAPDGYKWLARVDVERVDE